MVTPLSPTGDVIRDEAEAVTDGLQQVEAILIEALTEAPVEPRAWAQYIGRALAAARQARQANAMVKEIIYDNRRRNGGR